MLRWQMQAETRMLKRARVFLYCRYYVLLRLSDAPRAQPARRSSWLQATRQRSASAARCAKPVPASRRLKAVGDQLEPSPSEKPCNYLLRNVVGKRRNAEMTNHGQRKPHANVTNTDRSDKGRNQSISVGGGALAAAARAGRVDALGAQRAVHRPRRRPGGPPPLRDLRGLAHPA